MPKVKVSIRRALAKVNEPTKVKELKPQIKGRVKKALASVHASMAVEGLKPSIVTVSLGRQYLEGRISGQEAIAKVKARHLGVTTRNE